MTKVLNGDSLAKIEQYLDRHFEALEQIVKAIKESEQAEEYERLKGSVGLDGNGNGVVLLPVPLGYDYILERITVTSTGNGMCTLYENSQSPSDTLEVIGSSELYSDAFSNNIYVPGGSTVVIAFTGAGAGGTATYNLQIKRNKHRAHTHNPAHGDWWGNS